MPTAGADGVTRYLRRFGPQGACLRLAGLCVRVCAEDLEDELIRAAGAALVEDVFDAQGDLRSFRRMQRQPHWRGRAREAQLRRFLGAGSQRKLRYARLLVEAVSLDRIPRPLDAVLACV